MDKRSQRSEIKKKMAALTAEYIRLSDAAILDRLLSLPEYRSASFLFTYVSLGREVDTHALILHALGCGKRVAVPRCIGDGIMEFCEIRSLDEFAPGRMHIPEPGPGCVSIPLSAADFAVIPCVSCDRDRNRLGHGGGYYDRYLAQTSVPCAALCREALLLDAVCRESHDRSVDMVITERFIYA